MKKQESSRRLTLYRETLKRLDPPLPRELAGLLACPTPSRVTTLTAPDAGQPRPMYGN